VAWYNPVFQHANQTASVGAYLLMAGWIVFLYAMVRSAHHGRPAPANPWRAKSLEWQVPSPVPLENFAVQPVVTSDPYGYGQADDAPGGPDRTVENSAPVGRDGAERQGTPP
jgi:cytochrome c oxidase subunit 1